MERLAAIIGPTAVGKTDIALQVAEELKGEIISCDSMQVYRGMDVGTAKATRQEQERVKHHLIDVVDIDEVFSVAEYQRKVREIIKEVNADQRLPILVGGTGLYYQAVVDDYQFFPMEKKEALREKWEDIIKEQGLQYAYQTLQQVDPDYSRIISETDHKRIVRALEVYEITGQPFSSLQTSNLNRYKLAAVGLYMERHQLYDRINLRVEEMLENGLIEEVQRLITQGGSLQNNAMQALGYKQVLYYLDGFMTRTAMIEEIKRETRRYAKRQMTWFRRDSRIHWIDAGKSSKPALTKKICYCIEGQLGTV